MGTKFLTVALLLTGTAATVAASPRAMSDLSPSGQSYGPASGLHVQVEGTTSIGYRAVLYDGVTFVTGRGMVGPWDVTVAPWSSSGSPVDVSGNFNNIGISADDDFACGNFDGGGNSYSATALANAGMSPGSTFTADGLNFTWPNVPACAVDNVVASGQTIPVPNAFHGASSLGLVGASAGGPSSLRINYADGTSSTQTVTLSDWAQGPGSGQTTAATMPYRNTPSGPQAMTMYIYATVVPVDPAKTVSSITLPDVNNGPSMHIFAMTLGLGATRLQNRYTTVSYDARSSTLTLSGASNSVGGVTVTRFESYRFIGGGTIASIVGLEANGSITAYYSPYTDFPTSWQPMWAGGYVRSLDTPTTSGTAQDSPIPVLGVTNGTHVYGVASGATWDYPLPGYDTPHLVVNANRLAAPQMGTAAHPIQLTPNHPQQWETVLFRVDGSTPYAMEMGSEVAMAEALGFTQRNSPGLSRIRPGGPNSEQNQAAADLGLIMRATAYWLREGPSASGKALARSVHYSPATYMRDSFWTALGLSDSSLFASTEDQIFSAFTEAALAGGGQVPTALNGPSFPDESSMLYLIRMYDDVVVHHLPVKNLAAANLVLNYIRTKQVKHGAWMTTAPENHNGYEISPDTWLDGYLYPSGAISGYNQGIYVVTLMAAKQLGLRVTNAEIAQADHVYRSLYDPQLGYLRWLSTKTYKGPDVLVGDALSLLLFNRPLVPDSEVANTLASQHWTPYGMADLATSDNRYVASDEFRTLEPNDSGQTVAVSEPGGWYQNGGSWFLYEYLAEWAAARQGDTHALNLESRSIEDELGATAMPKEFKLTSTEPTYPYVPGSSSFQRQGYGWNAAYVAFAEVQGPSGVAKPVHAARPAQLPAPSAPSGTPYGPANDLHVVVTGTPVTGLAANIVDGDTLVSKRGMDGTDITVLAGKSRIQLQNRYTKESYDSATSTLTLSGAANTVEGTTLTRWESYRFVDPAVIQAYIGVSSSKIGTTTTFYYSPYTDFPTAWEPLRPIPNDYAPHSWFTTSYSSAGNTDANNEDGVPILGVFSGSHIYGVASGNTWQYPIPGDSSPHLTIQGARLGAPQIGDATAPVVLSPGASQKWMQVFYRSAPSAYRFTLQGELAMAKALGYTKASSPGVSGPLSPPGLPAAPVGNSHDVRDAMSNWGLILDATAYWELGTTTNGVHTVVPSHSYSPLDFMRDSFWTLIGLRGTLADQAEKYEMQLFSRYVVQSGPDAGNVPTAVLSPPNEPAYGADEAPLLYLIRMYYDVKKRGLSSALDVHDAALALQYVLTRRVDNNRYANRGAGACSWMDTAYAPQGSVTTYNQGLYVVALMAAQGLGLGVNDKQVSAAQAAYAGLYNASLGYLPWNSAPGYDHRAPDVLAGEAWALFLFNKSILPTSTVANTLKAQITNPYGMLDVATADGNYLDYTEPLELSQQVGTFDAPGRYQNGGNWYIFNYWAAYAGERLGISGATGLISWETGRELAVAPLAYEYTQTNAFLLYPIPVTYQIPMTAPNFHQGYGWNAAFNAFAATAGQPIAQR